MEKESTNISDEYWKAIVECDPSYDKIFLYGVQTTGIFCRPSCKSRIPNKANVHIFPDAQSALEKKFRPCKRCKPDGLRLPTEEWIEQITDWIEQHYNEPLTLPILADISHSSPSHLQRLFKRMKGLSPTEYVQQIRLEKAVTQLEETEKSIMHISLAVGFSSTPYFVTLFKKKLGCTPSDYRKIKQRKKRGSDHEPERIHY